MSTQGIAKQKAERLKRRLSKKTTNTIETIATKHAGHAEELAYTIAKKYRKPLIVSVSGDGGYNEVINGALRAKDENPQRQPVCAIYPAGNANDHRRSTKKHPLTWSINRLQPEPMDVLRLSITHGKTTKVRYAHSYIGLGVTSHAAASLNKEKLNPIKEILLVARTILTFHPVAVRESRKKTKSYDSLVFTNIHHMSKVFKVGSRKDINSGYFRVVAVPHRSDWWVLRTILNIITLIFGFKHLPQQESYEFSVPRRELIHLDGEVRKLQAHSKIRVEVARKQLLTLR